MSDRERWRAALVAMAWLATGGAIAVAPAPARAAWQDDLAAGMLDGRVDGRPIGARMRSAVSALWHCLDLSHVGVEKIARLLSHWLFSCFC